MSFFDDTRYFGILAMVVAVINIVASVLSLISDADLMWRIIDGAGGILAGIVILLSGYAIFTGRIPSPLMRLFPDGVTSKFGVITGYTAAIGLASLIGLGPSIAAIVWGALIGILLILIAWIVTDEKKDMTKKVVWVVLMVIYFFGIIHGVSITLWGEFNIISGICETLMFLIAFLYLFDMSVKTKFGM